MLILWCMKCWSGEGIRATGFVFAIDGLVVNPRHACVARVTVVGLCVCVCVCVCVCLFAGSSGSSTITSKTKDRVKRRIWGNYKRRFS